MKQLNTKYIVIGAILAILLGPYLGLAASFSYSFGNSSYDPGVSQMLMWLPAASIFGLGLLLAYIRRKPIE